MVVSSSGSSGGGSGGGGLNLQAPFIFFTCTPSQTGGVDSGIESTCNTSLIVADPNNQAPLHIFSSLYFFKLVAGR